MGLGLGANHMLVFAQHVVPFQVLGPFLASLWGSLAALVLAGGWFARLGCAWFLFGVRAGHRILLLVETIDSNCRVHFLSMKSFV